VAAGEIVEVGTPSELFDNPQEERTKKFLSQILEELQLRSTQP